jgi:hypothetical protein
MIRDDNDNDDMAINTARESIRENMKASTTENLGYNEL